MSAQKISELRAIVRDTPELSLAVLDIIAGAEALEREHRLECGCDRPGSTSCLWNTPEGRLLAGYDFDEETEHR